MQYGGFAPTGVVVHIYSLSVILFTQKSVARDGNPTKLFDKMNLNTPISDSSDFCKSQVYAQGTVNSYAQIRQRTLNVKPINRQS